MTMNYITGSVLTSGSSTISISNIPSDFTHLQLRLSGKEENNGSSNWIGLRINFNGDTGNNYSFHILGVYAVTGGGGQTIISEGYANISYALAAVPARGNGDTQTFGSYIIDIFDYANTNKFKTIKTLGGFTFNGTPNRFDLLSSNWRSTNAISSLVLTMEAGALITGTRVDLYGITTSEVTGA